MVNCQGLCPVCSGPDAENNSTHPRGQGPLLETRTRFAEVLDSFAGGPITWVANSRVKNNVEGKGSVTPMDRTLGGSM